MRTIQLRQFLRRIHVTIAGVGLLLAINAPNARAESVSPTAIPNPPALRPPAPDSRSDSDDLTETVHFSHPASEVYAAINQPRLWWSDAIAGDAANVRSVFYYHYRDAHRSVIQVTELVPGKRVAWRVLHNEFSFVKDRTEWIGTDIVFELLPVAGGTELRFTHVGLRPNHECYSACREGWHTYLAGSLRDLVETGHGHPNEGDPRTAHELSHSR